MPMEYLRDIAEGPFPLCVSDEQLIDKLRVLAAAGMVMASLPEPGTAGTAIVNELTGLGRATLKIRRPARLARPVSRALQTC